MLKGEAMMQGDFHPTSHIPLSDFDPGLMGEFEPTPGSAQPTSILATLSLGLSFSIAVGSGCPPETTVVIKNIVATESLYKWGV
jgi:hypothetical protein